jgi:hypothetical protein
MVKTNWTDPAVSSIDPSGAGVRSSGGDPNVSTEGSGGLKDYWPSAVVPASGGQETPNSVSGLPLRAERWEPSDNPPAPPSLQDRMPGTIDER